MKKLEFQEIYDWFKENISKYADTISSATGITYLYKKLKFCINEKNLDMILKIIFILGLGAGVISRSNYMNKLVVIFL